MKGLIFSIKRYSVHDGPGIRVSFFLKGCPLSCWWCHNPEGIPADRQKVTRIERIGTAQFCKVEDAGSWYAVNDILGILEKERVFFSESGGGVTFTGGEPLLQHQFLTEALSACTEKGFHTAVDTSGYAPAGHLKSVLPFTDLFLFDIKLLNDTKHIHYTGISNSLILSNFRMLIDSGKNIIVRIPVIPGLNDSNEDLELLRNFLEEYREVNLLGISLLPFHKIGVAKYKKFNMIYKMKGTEQPSDVRMKELKEFFKGTGIPVKVGS